ncbi:hypothetical protein R6Q59_036211 [Mikania micrantha]
MYTTVATAGVKHLIENWTTNEKREAVDDSYLECDELRNDIEQMCMQHVESDYGSDAFTKIDDLKNKPYSYRYPNVVPQCACLERMQISKKSFSEYYCIKVHCTRGRSGGIEKICN